MRARVVLEDCCYCCCVASVVMWTTDALVNVVWRVAVPVRSATLASRCGSFATVSPRYHAPALLLSSNLHCQPLLLSDPPPRTRAPASGRRLQSAPRQIVSFLVRVLLLHSALLAADICLFLRTFEQEGHQEDRPCGCLAPQAQEKVPRIIFRLTTTEEGVQVTVGGCERLFVHSGCGCCPSGHHERCPSSAHKL